MKSANLYLRIQWLAVLLTTSLIVQAATENLRIMTFNVPKTNIRWKDKHIFPFALLLNAT